MVKVCGGDRKPWWRRGRKEGR
jgi:hypothetical protein